MSQPEPKFSVGEVVSTRFPGPLNSNATPVLEREYMEGVPLKAADGTVDHVTGWMYLIGILGIEKWAFQFDLRPRPELAGQSLDQLMAELKTRKPNKRVPAHALASVGA